VFYPAGIAVEIACELETELRCTPDMLSYKGYTHRWLAVVAQIAPFTRTRILDVMRSSTAAAIRQCSGGGPPGYGRTCGFRWNKPAYDGTNGAGQEMNVLGALTSLLFVESSGPFTNTSGGTSKGDYNAGGGPGIEPPRDITQADRAGAGILTTLVLAVLTLTLGWMCTEHLEGKFD
jgi:mannan endo-1,6-alpha-mannosidase